MGRVDHNFTESLLLLVALVYILSVIRVSTAWWILMQELEHCSEGKHSTVAETLNLLLIFGTAVAVFERSAGLIAG